MSKILFYKGESVRLSSGEKCVCMKNVRDTDDSTELLPSGDNEDKVFYEVSVSDITERYQFEKENNIKNSGEDGEYLWVSPKCRVFETGYMGHLSLAEDIMENIYHKKSYRPDSTLMYYGWVKVEKYAWYGDWHHITDAVMECMEFMGFLPDSFMKDADGTLDIERIEHIRELEKSKQKEEKFKRDYAEKYGCRCWLDKVYNVTVKMKKEDDTFYTLSGTKTYCPWCGRKLSEKIDWAKIKKQSKKEK